MYAVRLPLILETQVFRQTPLYHLDELIVPVPLCARLASVLRLRSADHVNRTTGVRVHGLGKDGGFPTAAWPVRHHRRSVPALAFAAVRQIVVPQR